MQDPYLYSQIKAQVQPQPQFPEQEQLKCPRCDSLNTKFCYYNNYNLSQPRHFCKSCKRYWTKGGSLRNIPVGGGSRKNTKRSSSASTSPSSGNHQSKRPASVSAPNNDGLSNSNSDAVLEPASIKGDNYGFSSFLESNDGQFGGFIDGQTLMLTEHFGGSDQGSISSHTLGPRESVDGDNTDGFLNIEQGGSSICWSTGYGWPDQVLRSKR